MKKKNKIYGLIGKEIEHSFSPQYFKKKFKKEKITDCNYKLFSLDEIDDFNKLIEYNNLEGLNVTIPYKEKIINYLDKIDSVAKEINAVNTIKIHKNKTIGYNTDVIGFEKSIKPLLKKYHRKAIILGTGGSSKAVAFVLNKLEIPYRVISRTKTRLTYKDVKKDLLQEHTIIINTTPLGMFPNIETYPDIDYKSITKKHLVYDLVYNPKETMFLSKAKEQKASIKNGLEMLEIQAEESWKIWNN